MDTERFKELVGKWYAFRVAVPDPQRNCAIKGDLYQVRNPGFNGSPPISFWDPDLVDPDDSMMAAVEHYFLCRCWVGTGVFPAWELRALSDVYDIGKILHVTPKHNPNKPTTPFTALQWYAREVGILAGEVDLKVYGGSAPLIARPPSY